MSLNNMMLLYFCVGEKMEETCVCCICESKIKKESIKHIKIKGNVKDICKECTDSIKGLV